MGWCRLCGGEHEGTRAPHSETPHRPSQRASRSGPTTVHTTKQQQRTRHAPRMPREVLPCCAALSAYSICRSLPVREKVVSENEYAASPPDMLAAFVDRLAWVAVFGGSLVGVGVCLSSAVSIKAAGGCSARVVLCGAVLKTECWEEFHRKALLFGREVGDSSASAVAGLLPHHRSCVDLDTSTEPKASSEGARVLTQQGSPFHQPYAGPPHSMRSVSALFVPRV